MKKRRHVSQHVFASIEHRATDIRRKMHWQHLMDFVENQEVSTNIGQTAQWKNHRAMSLNQSM